MLIRFSVTNFLSFKEPTELWMVASNERIHPDHVLRSASRNHPNILRMAAIYGSNAAGKSNFVKALKFVRNLVVTRPAPEAKIPLQRFRLDAACLQKPSQFEIEFRVENTNYAYSFSVDSERVLFETLQTTTNVKETLLFSRKTSSTGEVHVSFGPFFSRLKEKDKQFLSFIAQGTRPNQLFLHETVERNVERFHPAYNWFRRTLHLIEPSTGYRFLELRLDTDESFRDFLARVLKTAGTGISAVRTEEAGTEALIGLPEELIADFHEQLSEHKHIFVQAFEGRRFAITKRDDELRVLKLTTVHGNGDGTLGVPFEVHEESDGTQRLFDLIPMLYQLTVSQADKVYVVDEIGRSMHPHLIRMIVDMHLDHANAGKASQLIITTHETNLLDLDILRRDEIWFAEKRLDGSTDLYSLSDFQPRYDKDIRRDYLVGRYGGIPFIGNTRQLRLPAMNSTTSIGKPEEGNVL
ncbi:MAG: ATP/GTP-binding protein [Chloroflexales bacterium]|nr:ATP/GTP-binding protein [Chloroflexales bacterium]